MSADGTGPSGPSGPTPPQPDPGPTGPGRMVIRFPHGIAVRVAPGRWLVQYSRRGVLRTVVVHRRRAARRLLTRFAI